jgi:hypothetical protein
MPSTSSSCEPSLPRVASWCSPEDPARLGDTTLTVIADAGVEAFGVVSNPHLSTTARTTQFRMAVDLSKPDEFSYDQETFMYQPRIEGVYCHRDRNTLSRLRT